MVRRVPAYNVVDGDLFELLENDADYFCNMVAVFIIVEQSGWCKHDFILQDQLTEFLDDDEYIPDTPLLRVSSDTKCNPHGIKTAGRM